MRNKTSVSTGNNVQCWGVLWVLALLVVSRRICLRLGPLCVLCLQEAECLQREAWAVLGLEGLFALFKGVLKQSTLLFAF